MKASQHTNRQFINPTEKYYNCPRRIAYYKWLKDEKKRQEQQLKEHARIDAEVRKMEKKERKQIKKDRGEDPETYRKKMLKLAKGIFSQVEGVE